MDLIALSMLVVAVTVAIHGVGTFFWIGYVVRRLDESNEDAKAPDPLFLVTATTVCLLLLHIIQVVVWALVYLMLPTGGQLNSFNEAAYFSIVTFTTLGYGDITLADPHWRLLSGIEALNGIVLLGWTTALLLAVVQRSLKVMEARHSKRES